MNGPVPIEIYLVCFGAASVIHAAQVFLSSKLLQLRSECDRVGAQVSIAIGVLCFFWQFGNFLAMLALSAGFVSTTFPFQIAQVVRDASLMCFPLLFSYVCLHLPPELRSSIRNFGASLRFLLWPWSVFAVALMAVVDVGFPLPWLWPKAVGMATLHLMLLYFIILTVTFQPYRGIPHKAGARALTAGIVASVLAIGTFVLMLSGYWHLPVPFLGYIELAAMLTSVPFVIAAAYRLYQFPFMDAFIREVITGVILLVGFAAPAFLLSNRVGVIAIAVMLAYFKPPLTRWVERTFLGYEEPAEEQEERIGNAIRALTRLDEFPARVSEILATELEADWVEIGSPPRNGAVHHFDIPGSNLSVSIGPRVEGRRYMSRQLRVARTAALQLAAHHHQLIQHEMRDLTARAQMRALQAQINPHFLFNTLNVLANLIHSNPPKAERVTEELADVFRYALESTRTEWVKLDDELHFIESYLEIEKARFEERLIYSFDIDPEIRSLKIPPMILQPLVENAIKHGIGPKVEGGEVRIQARLTRHQVLLTIEDTGVGRHSTSPRQRGAGIALSNVRERLQHLYGKGGTLQLEDIDPAGTRAVLTLPQMVGVHS
jgi:signal transduction histidine kinase